MQSLLLAKTKKEWLFIILFFIFIFISNIIFEYYKYKTITKDEIYTTNAKIINIYQKDNYDILKLSNTKFLFFTSTNKNSFIKNQYINITFLSNNISFLSYLKGFYANSFNLSKINHKKTIHNLLESYITNQHNNKSISSLFNALFLAIPLDKYVQNIISAYGISHLIAISGFHLGVLAFLLYFILNLLYKPIHQKYFPYRNKKYDLLILSSILIFSYLCLLSNQAPLLRAFVMYIFAIFALRSNIKLLSFNTLFLCFLFIISLFPNLLFSISFWFSICGVFYIFLFLQYFKSRNKIFTFIFLNIWLYLSINPISHIYFPTTSIYQLFSPFITMAFTLFYPLELFLHIFNIGDIFDNIINIFIQQNIPVSNISTNIYFLILYLITSIFSIKSKKAFILLNLLIIIFNIYLYTSYKIV